MKAIKYANGKYDVVLNGFRIGHITGAKTKWLAEYHGTNIGYFKSKKSATMAIASKHKDEVTEVKKNPTKKRATKKRASKRNPIAAAAKPRPVTRQTKLTRPKAEIDHVIVSVLKPDAAGYAKKHNIDLPAKVYFDGFDWTVYAAKAARYHDIAQARKVANAVANSRIHGGTIAKSRSVGIETDTPGPKR